MRVFLCVVCGADSSLVIASASPAAPADAHRGGVPWVRLQWWGVLLGVGFAAASVVMAWLFVFPQVDEPTDLRVYALASSWLWAGLDPYSRAFELVVYQGWPWTNPVPAAVLYAPLGWGSVGVWDAPWLGVQFVALAGVVWLSFGRLLVRVPRRGRRVAALVGLVVAATGLDSVIDTFALGQVNVLVALLVLTDVVAAGQHPWVDRLRRVLPRGVLVGVAAAVKVTPGLVIVWWLVTRQFRAAAWAVGTFAGLWVAAFVVAPAVTWRWVTQGGAFEGVQRLGDYAASLGNQSLMANVSRWVDVVPAPGWMWIPAAVVVIVVGMIAGARAYRGGYPLAGVVLVMLPALLSSPIAWTHHGVWLIPAFAVILGDGRDPRRVFWLMMSTPLWFVHNRTWGEALANATGFTAYYATFYVLVFVAVWWVSGHRTSGYSADRGDPGQPRQAGEPGRAPMTTP